MKKIIPIALCLNIFSPSLFAEDVDLNPIVVVGSRQEQRLSDVMTSVNVITRQDIERLQPQDIGSILQGQPGIEIVRAGGLGMQTSIFMRGTNSSQVLVLVDGMKLTDEFSNATPLQNIPIGQVDHIEILRGNASALYGPRAMGGVIQIFTKSGVNTSGPYGSASYGSRNTKNVTGGYSQKFSDTLFNVSLNHQETGGFASKNPAQNDANSIANPTKNAYNSNSVSINISKAIMPGQEVGIKILGSKFNTFFDVGFDYFSNGNDPDGVNGMNKLYSTNISSQIFMKNQINDFWSSKVTYGVSNINNRFDYNFNQSQPIGNYQTYQKDFSWLNDFVISNNQTFLLGLQSNQLKTKDEDTSFGISRFKGSRIINSALAGYTGKFDAIGLQLNIRHDNISIGDGSTTGLFGLSYDIDHQWKWAGNISNAFSAPTSAQLHNIGSGGNPNLKPEEDTSMETSLQYIDDKKTLRVVYFDRETTNLIENSGPVVGPANTKQLANTAKSGNTGVEISGQAILDSFTFKASATFQDPINKVTNIQLIRRAENFGSFEINYAFNKFKVGSQAFFSSSALDIPVNISCVPVTSLCRKNGGYAIANLYGSYTYDKNWSASLNIENLFDKTYQKNYGFNTPGFGAFLVATF
ncbi:MAG: TonB-dependent receptor [Chitinophagia bacterium]|nr:TonB-dependent receptor [Chitinophagia bacterium]